MVTCFDRGENKSEYPYRLKIPFLCYNQDIEDFCYNSFGCNWGIRYYSENEFYLTIGYYIFCFKYEEDAVLFKMSYDFAIPLSENKLE